MSVAAVAGAAKSAAAKPNHAVYLFRHIQTSQVLISLKSSVEKQSLKQIADTTRRPPHVRPDHWHPLIAIQGFSHHQDALAFHNSLRDHQLNLHSAKLADKKHMLQPRRLRAPQEMNQLDETLVKMVELLNENPKIKESKGNGIQILWEREGVRKQLLEKEGVSLLEGIQHGDLVIKRGRDIANA
ncbi:hypothetical protein BC939DRAFT_444932 [Gamsiella multidivaricata]|uniref:uncharacterized protein n=1 Tax=Gamsiella multidivaricata TaxID=101098 RepID=UPI0022201E88|nr:uncharacterized protein BC939DRAFT_444932 [Gamsiella multidivaricata]KAI7827677.1 hypothetical protein BC939DRAFT_444932 [Gamsiella multidivaricata]